MQVDKYRGRKSSIESSEWTYVRKQAFLAVIDVGDRDLSLGHVVIVVNVIW